MAEESEEGDPTPPWGDLHTVYSWDSSEVLAHPDPAVTAVLTSVGPAEGPVQPRTARRWGFRELLESLRAGALPFADLSILPKARAQPGFWETSSQVGASA